MKKIAHYISSQGLMSRRMAERMIEAGRVKMNGSPAKCAMRCKEGDMITIDDKPIQKRQIKLYAFNKPPMYLVSHRSTDHKKTIFDIIDKRLGHLTFCGRLDYLSEGLVLLTNSPALAHRLTSEDMLRVYVVETDSINPKLFSFCKNPCLDGEKLKPIEIIKVQKSPNTQITLGLFEGKNREIRRIMKLLKMKIFTLKRIAHGPFICDIPPGSIKEVDWSIL